MKITMLDSFVPPAGKVLEIRVPQANIDQALAAPASDRPAAFIQGRHVRRMNHDRREGRKTAAWLGICFRIANDRWSPERLAETVEIISKRHGTLASWFEVVDDDDDFLSRTLKRHEVDPELFTFEVAELTDVPEDPDGRREYLRKRGLAATGETWPGFVVFAIETEDGAYVIDLRDHTHSDGVSEVVLMAEYALIYDALTAGEDHPLPPTGSHIDFAAEEAERMAALTLDSPDVKKWLTFLDAHGGGLPRFPLPLGLDENYSPVPGRSDEFALLGPDETSRFAEVCKEAGGNTSGGVLAVLAIVGAELAGATEYANMAPIDLRPKETHALSQGWFVNSIPVAFEVADGQTFRDLVPVAQGSFRAGKELGPTHIARVAQLMIDGVLEGTIDGDRYDMAALSAIPPLVSYADVRRYPVSDRYDEMEAVGLGEAADMNTVAMWISRFHRGLVVQVAAPKNAEADASIEAYTTRAREIMEDIVANGDHTVVMRAETASDA